MKFSVVLSVAGIALFANYAGALEERHEHEVLSKVVAMVTTATKTSVIKSPTVVITEMGDITIEPLATVHYDISFRVARGPLQHARMAGDKTVPKIKELEYVANQKKQAFVVMNIVRAAR